MGTYVLNWKYMRYAYKKDTRSWSYVLSFQATCPSSKTVTNGIIISRSNHRRCSVKKVFLKISQNSQENTCVGLAFLLKSQTWGLQLYKYGTPTQMFDFEFGEIFNSLFFIEHLRWLLISPFFTFIVVLQMILLRPFKTLISRIVQVKFVEDNL